MPRKKKPESESPELTAETASPESGQPAAGGTPPEEPEPAEGSPKYRPVRDTFTSTLAGVRAGEDKRFKSPQVFVDFDDKRRASDDEKAELKDAGFRYRPSDKGYSALANPKTREARDELAQKFTDRRLKEKADPGEGQER